MLFLYIVVKDIWFLNNKTRGGVQLEEKLFPQYLNVGSKGAAVAALQIILRAKGLNPHIVVDGDYGTETITGVLLLQKWLGVEADGNFGPATRQALLERTGFDVNQIPVQPFLEGTQAVEPK